MIRIVAVDDDQIIRTGSLGLLKEAARNKIIADAGGGEKAVDLVRKLKLDDVLIAYPDA
jgi:YesN/AraC family two-component response regulator